MFYYSIKTGSTRTEPREMNIKTNVSTFLCFAVQLIQAHPNEHFLSDLVHEHSNEHFISHLLQKYPDEHFLSPLIQTRSNLRSHKLRSRQVGGLHQKKILHELHLYILHLNETSLKYVPCYEYCHIRYLCETLVSLDLPVLHLVFQFLLEIDCQVLRRVLRYMEEMDCQVLHMVFQSNAVGTSISVAKLQHQ